MNSFKAKPTVTGEPGSGIAGNLGGYAGLAELRKALGANLRSGLDYLTPAETELPSSYAIAELVAMIDNLAEHVQVTDSGESGEADFRTRTDADGGAGAESVSQVLRQQFIEEHEARLAAERREAELREKVAELSQNLARARAGSDGDRHDGADYSGTTTGSAVQHETRLRIAQSEGHDIEFVVDRDEISIGRTADNEIHIRSPSVSRHHARIVRKNARSRIIDSGSKNGVYVNSFRVAEQELHDGDQIIIGTVELTYSERVKN